MKDIRPAIRQILLNNATVSGLVGGSRVYPILLPQGITSPSVVYFLVTEDTTYNMRSSDNLISARYQIDGWALTADLSAQLGDACFDALSGFRGVVAYGSNSPQSTVNIHGVFHDIGRDEYDSTAKLFARRRDYFFKFAEY
jgi:hypothetical protein